MAKLTEEEAAQLKALQEKESAPDEEPSGNGLSRVLNISVDLGDDAQVERALRLGLLSREDLEDPEEGEGEGEGEAAEEGPRRRGFFPDGGEK